MVDKDYVDARIEASRAQNDARFAEVLARLDQIETRIGSFQTQVGSFQTQVRDRIDANERRVEALLATKASTSTVVGTGVSVGIALFAAIVALLGFGFDRFDSGAAAVLGRDHATRALEERLRDIEEKMSEIIPLLQSSSSPAAPDRALDPAGLPPPAPPPAPVPSD